MFGGERALVFAKNYSKTDYTCVELVVGGTLQEFAGISIPGLNCGLLWQHGVQSVLLTLACICECICERERDF